MKRGDVVEVALPGEYGKPRPALVIQSDLFIETHSVTIIPLTSHLVDAPLLRISVEPSTSNGLQVPSQAMIDKVYTTVREKVGAVVGQLEHQTMLSIERALALFIGIV